MNIGRVSKVPFLPAKLRPGRDITQTAAGGAVFESVTQWTSDARIYLDVPDGHGHGKPKMTAKHSPDGNIEPVYRFVEKIHLGASVQGDAAKLNLAADFALIEAAYESHVCARWRLSA